MTSVPERTFTLRLHFAKLDDVQAGQRVFDVKVQSRDALMDLDVVKEVGVRTALVKEVAGVKARGELIIELAGKAEAPTGMTAPMLSAIELCEEGFRPPAMEILSAGQSKH